MGGGVEGVCVQIPLTIDWTLQVNCFLKDVKTAEYCSGACIIKLFTDVINSVVQ